MFFLQRESQARVLPSDGRTAMFPVQSRTESSEAVPTTGGRDQDFKFYFN